MWACRYGYDVCGFVGLGWVAMGKIFKDKGAKPPNPS
jgi:hypothetical protein